MILTEILTGKLEKYDFASGKWVQLMALNNANVIRADAQRQCTNDDRFMIGGVFAATMNIVVMIPATITSYQVRGCRITLASSLAGAIGVFWVTNVQRTGRIFTLSCHDAVSWTDVSSYTDTQAELVKRVIDYFPTNWAYTAEGWMNATQPHLTWIVNRLLYCMLGIPSMVGWQNFQMTDNFDYCCADILFGIFRPEGKGETDCPRDLFRHLAEVTFGFVYALPDTGNLTLGQFADPHWGTVTISENEIEYDSGEFADFTTYMNSVTVIGKGRDGQWDSSTWRISSPNYDKDELFDIVIEDNPFIDGSYRNEIEKGNDARQLIQTLANRYYLAFHRPAEIVQKGYGFLVSPFKCTVHGQHTFRLGQKVLVQHRDAYGNLLTHDSIITKICWSFQGGQTLMCCGSDTRTMSQTLKMSKADKLQKELENCYQALERRTVGISQADYDALGEYDSHTLYCII